MLYTTLNEIREHSPYKSLWEKLLTHLNKTKADDDRLSFSTILESLGVQDTLWCLRVLPKEMLNDIKLLACDLAEAVLNHVPKSENRPRLAIQASRDYIGGKISRAALIKAASAAADAAADSYADAAADSYAAYTAAAAAYAAAYIAYAEAAEATGRSTERNYYQLD